MSEQAQSTEAAVALVRAERDRQVAKGYDIEHDRRHGVYQLVEGANRHARASHECGLFHLDDVVEAAAILIAAVEVMQAIAERDGERHNEKRCAALD